MHELEQERPTAEVVPEPTPEPHPVPGPWSDPLPPTIPKTPPEEPETWPFPEAEPEPEAEPTPVPAARHRPQLTPEQQATRQAGIRIANALGETEPGPRAQVGRVIRVIGVDRAQGLYEQTLEVEAAGGLMLPDDSRRRTAGGVFFKLVRDAASREERWKMFPMRTQGNKLEQPADVTQPTPSAAPPTAVITEIPNATGEARTVKITLIGRPSRIVSKPGYIITGMTARTVPALPKGMPTPPTTPTTYTVYISHKHWQKVAASLQGNPEDVLVVEGTPVYDPQLEGIAVYVTNATTKLLQQAQRAAQAGS